MADTLYKSSPVWIVKVGPEITTDPEEQNLALRKERNTSGPKKILKNGTRVEVLEPADKDGWASARVLNGDHEGESGVLKVLINKKRTMEIEKSPNYLGAHAPGWPALKDYIRQARPSAAAPPSLPERAEPVAPPPPPPRPATSSSRDRVEAAPAPRAQAGLSEEEAVRAAKEHILHLPKPHPPPNDHFKDPTTKKGAALAFYLKKEEMILGRPLTRQENEVLTKEVKTRIKEKGSERGLLKHEDAAILIKQAREDFEKHRGFIGQMETWLKNPSSIPSLNVVPKEWMNMDAGWGGLIKGIAGQVGAEKAGKFTPFVANSGPLQGDSRIIGFSNVTTAHISRAALNPFLKGTGIYKEWRESPLYNTPQHQEDVLRLFSMAGHRPDSALARVALESMGGTSNAALLFNNYAGLMAQKRSDSFDFERYPNPVVGFAAAATWINRKDKPYVWENVTALAELHKNYTPPDATNVSETGANPQGHGSLIGIAHRLYQGPKKAAQAVPAAAK